MKTTFIHIADVHLGNVQYGNDERFDDFYKALVGIFDAAIAQQVQFVIVAGDIFHKRAIDAQTLYQATNAFGRLRQAGIPVIVIEGNHDKAYYSDGSVSWLSFLAYTSDITLLAHTYDQDQIGFPLVPDNQRFGGAVDIPNTGIRIYGITWAGSQTARFIHATGDYLRSMQAEEAEQGVKYRILMIHTGLDGIVPSLHGLPTPAQFEPLRGLVDYVAMGHVHKPFVFEDWLYNPGSTETVSAEEYEWHRGYYLVTVDTDSLNQPRHVAQHIENHKRPFIRWSFAVDGLPTPEDLIAKFSASIDRHIPKQYSTDLKESAPVVDVTLRGRLAFDQNALDRKKIEELVTARLHPLHVIIRNQTDSFDAVYSESESANDDASLQLLEQHIFAAQFDRDSRYSDQSVAWAKVLADVKRYALDGDAPAAIATWLTEERIRIEETTRVSQQNDN